MLILTCDQTVAAQYKSSAQRARVISESWTKTNGFCLACSSDVLRPTAANTRSTDFICISCEHRYELKSFERRPSKSLVDGAYASMISRIFDGTAPTLLLMERSQDWQIVSFSAINSLFLTPDIIDRRQPLSASARRAGWVGCNIRLDRLAPGGEVHIVNNGVARTKQDARIDFQRFLKLKALKPGERGWTALILSTVRNLGSSHFTLDEVYAKEQIFSSRFPNNHNVRAKIRQQLQVLRDLGYISFDGGGHYSLTIS